MFNKRSNIAAVAIAFILSSAGIVGAAYAQDTNATGIQIQVVPEIQRGHNQHLTLYAVDDDGNPTNETITTQITNSKGKQVGPGVIESQSGDVLTYKVGPRTNPQNITVYSYIPGTDIDAAQNYWVFPKGQAQQPERVNETAPPTEQEPFPEPPIVVPPEANVTEPTPLPNGTIPEPPLPPEGNETGGGVIIEQPTNATEIPINNTGITNATTPGLNQTQNATTEGPTPPTEEGQGNATGTGEGENPQEQPPAEQPPAGNETVPIEGNVTTTPPQEGNATIPIEGNVTIGGNETTTTEPEPPVLVPGNVTEPPAQGQDNQTETPAEEPQLGNQNSTQAFDNIDNSTAILGERLDQLDEDNEENTEAQRADLRAAIGEGMGAMGEAKDMVVNATNDQLISVQDLSLTISEAIDVVTAENSEEE